MKVALPKLVLGTAQFGMAYGVTNQSGKVPFAEVVRILQSAAARGLNILDSASAYGDSQQVLGKALQEARLQSNFKVVTKVHLKNDQDIQSQVYGQIEKTLQDLNGAGLEAVMVHHGYQICDFAPELPKILAMAKKEFSIPKIGGSFYYLSELVHAGHAMALDIIQIPFNVFNQDFIGEPLRTLKQDGVEVHARSVFLQGLLLVDNPMTRPYFGAFEAEFSRYRAALAASEMTPIEFNLANANREPLIDKIVFGVTTAEEFEQIVAAAQSTTGMQLPATAPLASKNESLTNPANWKV